MRVVVALGGNAIQLRDELGTAAEQRVALRHACLSLAQLCARHEVILSHGNGPQVGRLLELNELGVPRLPGMPLDVLVAETQGMVGYLVQQELSAALRRAAHEREVVSIVTQVVVDPEDPAFLRPSKPVGPFLPDELGTRLHEAGIPVVRVGDQWRRTVPSPAPLRILEERSVRAVLEAGCIPIVAGGGGVPVVPSGAGYRGVAGVVDKDRTAAVIARTFDADVLLILTDVAAVEIEGLEISRLSVADARAALDGGVFPIGSMGPKIEAALSVAQAGKRAVIAHLDHALDALEGKAGTEIG